MMNNYIAKSICNYIHKYNLSEKYEIIPFEDILLDEKEDYKCILEKYESIDKVIEYIRANFRIVKSHIYTRVGELPSSLNKMGHILEYNSIGIHYFYGRESELKKINVIRNKRIKNNVLIVGNPGTGKTSLIEAYAKYYEIKNIFIVECAKLVGNTEYRGAFEQKVVELMKFAKSMNLILFFDELHVLLDLGKSKGGISITDILKPYLLDEDLCFIGATTVKEVQMFLADEAFKRRFTTILLDEPSDEQLISIKNMFEGNIVEKSVLGKKETLNVIKELREKLTTQYFPDKFIDFLDYMYAFREVIDKNVNYEELLKEYINDQRLEIVDIEC